MSRVRKIVATRPAAEKSSSGYGPTLVNNDDASAAPAHAPSALPIPTTGNSRLPRSLS
jgi:hypothetical protein